MYIFIYIWLSVQRKSVREEEKLSKINYAGKSDAPTVPGTIRSQKTVLKYMFLSSITKYIGYIYLAISAAYERI